MKWDDMEQLPSGVTVWRIPEADRKCGGSGEDKLHVVPLLDEHLKLLEQAYRLRSDSPYVFPLFQRGTEPVPARNLGRSIREWLKSEDRFNKTDHFTPYSARHTFKTLGAQAGIDITTRNRLQGHGLSDVGSQHYDSYDYLEEKRRGMRQYVDYINTILTSPDQATHATGRKTRKVVELFPQAV